MPGRRIRARCLRAIGAAVVISIVLGPAAAHAADRTPIVVGRQIIAPYMDTQAMPNRALAKDAKGVVLASYGGTLGNQYNPVTISQAAITYYFAVANSSESAAQKAKDRAALMIQAEWLVSHQDSAGLWHYTFPWEGQPVPWVSAMAEGLGISALIRANALGPDPRYVRAIERARATFDRTWSNGGVSTWQTLGTKKYLVYEEYMLPHSPHTLNGWMFAMAGLHEAWTYLKDDRAKLALDRADRGIAALRALLPYYDTGSWSTYNLKRVDAKVNGSRAKLNYHQLHIRQLHWYAKITGDDFFERYADRWQRYLDTCLPRGTCPG